MDDIETHFLCEGCQTPQDVAKLLADFLHRATKSIDISIYSVDLGEAPHLILHYALQERVAAGVAVRIAFDAGSQQDSVDKIGNDVCDHDTPACVRSLGFPFKPIEGYRSLMHDKYVVIDPGTDNAQVWTGSTNWSNDSWSLQENNIIIVHSPGIADLYQHDFDDLWVDGNIASSGVMDSGEATVHYKGDFAYVFVNFSPGEGEWIDEDLARQIERTTQHVTIAAVVMTSGHILGALRNLMQRKIPIDGIYDWSQMEGVKYQWSLVPDNNWKIDAWEELVEYGHLVGKKSTPYTPSSSHDYMHNKVMVLDDVTVTGSYNFSRHAQQNAENILLIKSQPLADTYRQYIYSMVERYKAAPPSPAARKAAITPPAPNR